MAAHENNLAIELLKDILQHELADQGMTPMSYVVNTFFTTSSFNKPVKGLGKLCQFKSLKELQAFAKKQFLRQSLFQTRTDKTDEIYHFLTGFALKEEFTSIEDLLIKLLSYRVNDTFLLSDASREDIEDFLQQHLLYPEEVVQDVTLIELTEINLLDEIDFYKLGNRLGVGASSKIYKATAKLDASNSVPVAVKMFTVPKDAEEEIAFFKKLHSPYIVTCLGAYNKIHLVLELMDKCDLEHYIRDTINFIPDLSVRLNFIKDIALGLLYLHRLKIVHQDLKLQNIFVKDDDGKICLKIGDFGLSKHEGHAGKACGTHGYFPPEIIRARKRKQNYSACRKSDIYSFSMVMLLIIHWQNKLLFPTFFFHASMIIAEVFEYTLSGKRPLNNNPQSKAPSGMTLLIHRSWAQEPEQRPNATDIVREISRQQLKLP